jgi:hypothetical protein
MVWQASEGCSVRLILQFLAVLALLWPVEALAAVRIDFRSRDSDSRFPHAFVVVTGTVDSTGEKVAANYGFTLSETINITILAVPAGGMIHAVRDADIFTSNLHFTLILTDQEYAKVIAMVEEWRNLPQPSYRLRERNCVTFVAQVATLLGLDGSMVAGLELKPHGFLDSVRDRNAARILARGGFVYETTPEVRRTRVAKGFAPVETASAPAAPAAGQR